MDGPFFLTFFVYLLCSLFSSQYIDRQHSCVYTNEMSNNCILERLNFCPVLLLAADFF